jgi:hypothetical protein
LHHSLTVPCLKRLVCACDSLYRLHVRPGVVQFIGTTSKFQSWMGGRTNTSQDSWEAEPRTLVVLLCALPSMRLLRLSLELCVQVQQTHFLTMTPCQPSAQGCKDTRWWEFHRQNTSSSPQSLTLKTATGGPSPLILNLFYLAPYFFLYHAPPSEARH